MDPHTGQALEGEAALGGLRPEQLSYPTGYGRKYRWLVEAIWVLVAYTGYEFVRSRLGNERAGLRNGETIVRWEKHLQHFALDHKTFTQFLNLYYGTVHFIVPVVVLIGLWRYRPSLYSLWRNRLFVLTLIALVGFWLWPLAPPRLLPSHYGFVDTDALYGGQGILNEGAAKDTNLYAAMPSLHVGWALWCAAAAGPILRRRWLKAAVYLYPLFTFATVTATGNHYWLDGFAGIAVDLIGYWVGLWITRAGQHNNAVGDDQPRHNGEGYNEPARVDAFVKQPEPN